MIVEGTSVVNIYTGTILKEVPVLFFLEAILRKEKPVEENLWNLFQGAPKEASFDFLHVVENPADADFLLCPHNYATLQSIEKERADEYMRTFVFLSQKYNKKILIFALADSDEHIDIPNSVIFRYSQYKYKKRENEVMVPPYTFHFRNKTLAQYRKGVWNNITFRAKRKKPIVSFCGWADFPNLYRKFTYGARVLWAHAKKLFFFDAHALLHTHGIYWRRKAIRALKHSTRLETRFLLRKSFSAQKGFDGTQKTDSETAEKEYIENIVNSDFVLAPKGHANESVRFYEALSLGRFPVLIDTDRVLPLKEHIDYDKCIITIPHTDMRHMEQKILDFYNHLTDEEFQKRQKMAREAFELLRPGSFLKIVLSELKQSLYGSK